MKWRRHRTGEHEGDRPEVSEAREARVQSEEAAESARRDWARVHTATEHLRQHRIRNGFSEILVQTIRDVR